MRNMRTPVLNLAPQKSRRWLPRPGRAEVFVAVVAVIVWVAVGYGIAAATGIASLPLGP